MLGFCFNICFNICFNNYMNKSINLNKESSAYINLIFVKGRRRMEPTYIGPSAITSPHCRQILWDQRNHPNIDRMLGLMRSAMSRGHRNDLYMDAESLTSPCVSLHVVEVTEDGRLSLRMGSIDPYTGLPGPKALKGLVTVIDCGKDAGMVLQILNDERLLCPIRSALLSTHAMLRPSDQSISGTMMNLQ